MSNIEENKRLIEEYPFLLPRSRWTGEVSKDYDYSYTELDNMPKGWRKAFGEELCGRLKDILVKSNSLNDYRITDIKEKFGFLHWYWHGVYDDEIDKVITEYENKSKKTCIKCGEPASMRNIGGWLSPYCDKCVDELGKGWCE